MKLTDERRADITGYSLLTLTYKPLYYPNFMFILILYSLFLVLIHFILLLLIAKYRNHQGEYIQNVGGETCWYISIRQSQKCLANNKDGT